MPLLLKSSILRRGAFGKRVELTEDIKAALLATRQLSGHLAHVRALNKYFRILDTFRVPRRSH